MNQWSDISPAQRKKLPPETQIVLLRLHVRKWIEYWCEYNGVKSGGFVEQFDQLIRLCRTHPYKKRRTA